MLGLAGAYGNRLFPRYGVGASGGGSAGSGFVSVGPDSVGAVVGGGDFPDARTGALEITKVSLGIPSARASAGDIRKSSCTPEGVELGFAVGWGGGDVFDARDGGVPITSTESGIPSRRASSSVPRRACDLPQPARRRACNCTIAAWSSAALGKR